MHLSESPFCSALHSSALCTLALLLVFSEATAQFSWDSPRKNLQILSDTISGPDLRSTMMGFTQGLGVRCSFCHDDSKGRGLDNIDFASDAKPEKEIARHMMKMTRELNREWIAKVSHGESDHEPRVKVTCITCHRGVNRPEQIEDILMGTVSSEGVEAAKDQYRELRDRYYGRMAYDFSQWSLNRLGYRLLHDGLVDEAIEIFQMNVELNPGESNPYDSLGEAYEAKGDTARALVFYRKAVELNPDNQRTVDKIQALR